MNFALSFRRLLVGVHLDVLLGSGSLLLHLHLLLLGGGGCGFLLILLSIGSLFHLLVIGVLMLDLLIIFFLLLVILILIILLIDHVLLVVDFLIADWLEFFLERRGELIHLGRFLYFFVGVAHWQACE